MTGTNAKTVDRKKHGGKEIFEIQPLILGGSPTDPANKTLLTREQHIKAVVYWNQEISRLRDEQRKAT